MLPTLRELGIGFVPYSPARPRLPHRHGPRADDLADDDFRRDQPALPGRATSPQNLAAGRRGSSEIAREAGRTPAQVALAWVLAQGDDVVPIPGTKRPAYLEENVAAVGLELSAEQVATLDESVSPDAVRGTRYADRDMALLNR